MLWFPRSRARETSMVHVSESTGNGNAGTPTLDGTVQQSLSWLYTVEETLAESKLIYWAHLVQVSYNWVRDHHTGVPFTREEVARSVVQNMLMDMAPGAAGLEEQLFENPRFCRMIGLET